MDTATIVNAITIDQIIDLTPYGMAGEMQINCFVGSDGIYDTFKSYPAAIQYDGRVYGKSCHNCDAGTITYLTSRVTATVAN